MVKRKIPNLAVTDIALAETWSTGFLDPAIELPCITEWGPREAQSVSPFPVTLISLGSHNGTKFCRPCKAHAMQPSAAASATIAKSKLPGLHHGCNPQRPRVGDCRNRMRGLSGFKGPLLFSRGRLSQR